jgi:hypothetical protein
MKKREKLTGVLIVFLGLAFVILIRLHQIVIAEGGDMFSYDHLRRFCLLTIPGIPIVYIIVKITAKNPKNDDKDRQP